MRKIARFIDLELQKRYQVDVVEDGKLVWQIVSSTKP